MLAQALLVLLPLAAAAPTTPWNTALRSVARAPEQVWTRRQAGPGETVFDIGCTAFGPAQDPVFVDAPSAVAKFFKGVNGAAVADETCAANVESKFTCVPEAQAQQTACSFDAALAVWDAESMDCFARDALLQAVQSTCAAGGVTDCGCGVFKDLGSSKCLVASFTFHLSGLAVVNSDGFVGEPVPSNVTVNAAPAEGRKRDVLGPSYNDLTVCAFNNNGDVTGWCEGAETHVCQ